MDDFYIEKKGLAAYYEIEWLDKLREVGIKESLESKSKTVPDSFVCSIYHKQINQFITAALCSITVKPSSLLEVGPALGRNCYNLVQAVTDINRVTVVEPSLRFLSEFKKILVDGSGCEFLYLKDVNEQGSIYFDTAFLAEKCGHVTFKLINSVFNSDTVDSDYDLAVCLNVLDQCESPRNIVASLMNSTARGGVLVLSCSYQWNKKHLKDMTEALDDINGYFNESWVKIAEDEHEYKLRFNDRYSKLFLTHIVAYQKNDLRPERTCA